MASKPRRSTRGKDDIATKTDDHTSSVRTRRNSTIAGSSFATVKTPSKIPYGREKLNYNQIAKDLGIDSSDDEFEQPKNTKKAIGMIEKKNEELSNKDNLVGTPGRLSRNRKSVNQRSISSDINSQPRTLRSATPKASQKEIRSCSEDKIINRHHEVSSQNIYSTPTKNKESLKTKIKIKSVNSRNKHLNTDEDSGNEENEMQNANTHFSSTRMRSKSPCGTPKSIFATPSKRSASHFKDSTNTRTKILRTPSRKSEMSKDTSTKAFLDLGLNKFETPRSRRSLKIQDTSKKLPDQTLKENSSDGKNVCRSTRVKKPITYREDNDSTSEEVEESDDYQVDEEEGDESDSESISETESNSSDMYSPVQLLKDRRLKYSKKTLKNNLKTPSKTPKKTSMETPTKALSRLTLTPSMHQRTANIVKPSTPLQEARAKLHVGVLPKSLPCREEQFNDIYTFLHARLSDSSGGCIYISGVPGTGKTATVNEVIRCLRKSVNAGKLTEFKFIDINGMKLSEPRQAYVQIWKQLTGQSTTWEEAHKLLQDRFTKSTSKKGITLLLVDELDLLCTKRQDVVYNLLDWPSKSGAKLVVVTIANTMDLPERILMGKVTSRLGLTRLTFPPYNHKQLEEIVVSRLKGHNAFSGETIQLVARKVAAVSGDARRALDICRRATEVAETNDREMVSMIDVKQALDEMIASPKIQAIKHCSDMEQLFLQAVCAEVSRTGVEEVVFKNVYHQLKNLCIFNGERENIPNITEALSMCARLGSWRLLICDHSRMDIHQRIILNVSTDDVHFAIQSIEA